MSIFVILVVLFAAAGAFAIFSLFKVNEVFAKLITTLQKGGGTPEMFEWKKALGYTQALSVVGIAVCLCGAIVSLIAMMSQWD